MMHLQQPASALGQPTSYLSYKGRLLPINATLATKSTVLESLLRQAELKDGRQVIRLDSSQASYLAQRVGPLTPLAVERFLAALAGAALEQSCSEVDQVVQLLRLADWFDAHELRSRCDARLQALLSEMCLRQQVSDSREEAAAVALEAGVQHCLTKTVSWLLPWALQQLSLGDKECGGSAGAAGGSAGAAGSGASSCDQHSGELRSGRQQHTPWFADRQQRRRHRLHAALMADDQLKIVLMEQQWWAQRDSFEHSCPCCSACPADLRPAYDCTGEGYLWCRDGSTYRAAATHFAHLLAERSWGLTPAGTGHHAGAELRQQQQQQAAAAAQWPTGLTRSVSSVGQCV